MTSSVSGENPLSRVEQLEAALRRERAMFNGGPVVIFRWVATTGWPVEYVSSNVRELFGHPAEDFVEGRVAYASVVHPDDLERVAREVAHYSALGASNFEQEYRIVRPDGDVRCLYDYTAIIRNEHGGITHYDGYVLDISHRKASQAALAESEERYRMLADQTADIVTLSDVKWSRTYISPSFSRVTGIEPERLTDELYISAIHPDDLAIVLAAREKNASGESTLVQYRVQLPDGRRLWFETQTTPIRGLDGMTVERYLCCCRDISERKSAEEELRHRDAQIRQHQKMEALGRMAGGVAHDFNNLLTAILWYAEAIRNELGDPHPAAIAATRITQSADRAGALTRQLLAFSRK